MTYAGVEKHLRHSRKPVVVWSLVAGLVGLGVLSLGVIRYDWFVRAPTALEQQLSQAYSTEGAYRYKRCFLDPVTQGPQDFAAECSGTSLGGIQPSGRSRLVLLWGDSLAAQLYSGLANLVATRKLPLKIAQRTAGSCPPGLGPDRTDHGSCDDINAATREYIERDHPYAVVINGRWENGRAADVRIPEIVRYLRAQGVARIVLVGPTPDWAPDLKKLLLRRRFAGGQLPERLEPPAAFWSTTMQRQEQLKMLAENLGLGFISPIDAFCEGISCLIRVSGAVPEGLIASDHDHMTEQASEYLFRQPAVIVEIGKIFEKTANK